NAKHALKKKENKAMNLGVVARAVFLLEGVAMIITGPFLMVWPQLVLELYSTRHFSPSAVGGVQWFGALVLLMGWVEMRKWGRLDRPEIEAWLLADVAYAVCFSHWVNKHAEWNFWAVFSIVFPIGWAPLRIAMLSRKTIDYSK